jgi:hypothetical protein
MKGKGKFGSAKPISKDHFNKNSSSLLAMKEDISKMTTTEQILLIEELAEKITGNSGENVSSCCLTPSLVTFRPCST